MRQEAPVKKTKNTILLLITLLFSLCGLVSGAAAEASPDGSGAVQGIEAKITGTEFWLNEIDERAAGDVACEFINHNEEPLQQIDYVLYFWNDSGGLIFKEEFSYEAAEAPVGYEETAEDTQSLSFDSPSEPAFVSVEVLRVRSAADNITGRVPEPGDYLYLSMNDPALENIAEVPPVIIRVLVDTGNGQRRAEITYPMMIRKAVQDFMKIRIGNETEELVTDHYNGFSLIFADGHEAAFDLNGWNLEYRIDGKLHLFELDGFDDFHQIMAETVHPLE